MKHEKAGKGKKVPDIITYLRVKNSKKEAVTIDAGVLCTKNNAVNVLSGTEPRQLMSKLFSLAKESYQVPTEEVFSVKMSDLHTTITQLVKGKTLTGSQAMTVQQLARNLHTSLNVCLSMPDNHDFLQKGLQKDIYDQFEQEQFRILYSKNDWHHGDVIEAALLPPIKGIGKLCSLLQNYNDYDELSQKVCGEDLSFPGVELSGFMEQVLCDINSCYRGGKPGLLLFQCYGMAGVYPVCLNTLNKEWVHVSDNDPKSRVQLAKMLIKYPLSSQINEYVGKSPCLLRHLRNDLLLTQEGWFDKVRDEHMHIKDDYYSSITSLANKKDNTLMPFMIITGRFVETQCNPEPYMTWKHIVPQMCHNLKQEASQTSVVATLSSSEFHNPYVSQHVLVPDTVYVVFPGVGIPVCVKYDVHLSHNKTIDLDDIFMKGLEATKQVLFQPSAGPAVFDANIDNVIIPLMDDLEKLTKTRDFEMFAQEWKKRVLHNSELQAYGIAKLLREAVEHIGDHAIETASLEQFESVVLDYEFDENVTNNEFIQEQLCRMFFQNPYFVNFLLSDSNIEHIADVCRMYIREKKVICFKQFKLDASLDLKKSNNVKTNTITQNNTIEEETSDNE